MVPQPPVQLSKYHIRVLIFEHKMDLTVMMMNDGCLVSHTSRSAPKKLVKRIARDLTRFSRHVVESILV